MKRRQSILLFFITLLTFPPAGHAQQLWSGVLNPARGTNWTYAGVTGGIPSASWTQCVTTACNTLTSAGTSATAAQIAAALNSATANTYVLLGPGTYNLSNGICLTGLNNVELRGSGANSTFLIFSGAAACNNGNGTALIGFQSSDTTWFVSPGTIYNWTAGYSQGATSITLSSGSNITAGSTMIMLDQCDTGYSGSTCSGAATDNGYFFNCGDGYSASGPTGCSANGPDNGNGRPHRFQSEIVQAVSCSPSCGSAGTTTVTITPPLIHPNWASGQTPQAWLVQPSSYVGVRNLLVNGAATTDTAGISFTNVENAWVQGVALLHSYNIGVYEVVASHITVTDNYIFDSGQNLTYADPWSIKDTVGANNLTQNNIIQACRVCVANGEGPASGDVIAYNLCIFTNDAADGLWGSVWQHSNGDDYSLWEGNVADQVFSDDIHGTHLMETYYRNFFTGWESCANGGCGGASAKDTQLSAIDILGYNRYANVIANVLGTPGISSYNTLSYQYTGQADYYSPSGAAYIYNLANGDNAGTYPTPYDAATATTFMRWGNWDVYNGATQWNTSEVPSGISVYPNSVPTTACTNSLSCPPSFYLSSKPAWFGSTPFPPIGPDVSSGNMGQCSGTLNTTGQYNGLPALTNTQCGSHGITSNSWAGHINAIPAMACYLNVMGGPPDGLGGALTFNAGTCYSGSGAPPPAPPPAPTKLSATVQTVQ